VISITIPGRPVPQPRHQISTIGGFARAYIPKDHPIHSFKESVKLVAKLAMANNRIADGPIRISCEFVIDRPKSHTKKRRSIHRESHNQKPDLDNLVKALTDPMTGIVWVDDSQISGIVASKRWTNEGEEPGTTIEIYPA